MIYVIATIETAEGKREDFLKECRKIIPKVLAEKGCLEYGPTIDVATQIPIQIPLRENVVTLIEKWENVATLMIHLTVPHMLDYRKRVQKLITAVQIQVLEKA